MYERKRKFLLMLKWISRGVQITNSRDNPWFHECCVRFLLQLHSRGKSDDVVGKVLTSEVPKLFSEWPENISFVQEYNKRFNHRNQDTYPHVFRYTLCQCLIDPQHRDNYLSKIPLPNDNFKGVTWQECRTCLDILRRGQWTLLGRCDPSVIEKYRSACNEYFPMANAFLTTSQIDILRQNMIEAANSSAISGVFLTPNDKDQLSELNTDHESKLSNEFSRLTTEPLVNGDLKDSTSWIPQSCKQVTVTNKATDIVV